MDLDSGYPAPPSSSSSFNPTVTYITESGAKTCTYTSSDGCVYKPLSPLTTYTPFKADPPTRRIRLKLNLKPSVKKQAQSTAETSHAAQAPQLREAKSAKTLFMEFYREGCRVWYHKESFAVVEGMLETYWMQMEYEERLHWEKKAAELKVSVDADNAAVWMAEMMKV